MTFPTFAITMGIADVDMSHGVNGQRSFATHAPIEAPWTETMDTRYRILSTPEVEEHIHQSMKTVSVFIRNSSTTRLTMSNNMQIDKLGIQLPYTSFIRTMTPSKS